jgi:hypothetical protein
VCNRGERHGHDDEWEEPLLKRIKHLKEMTMIAEAALSVMSYESGQKHFYKTLAAMTDGQLLAALEAGSMKLSISGAQTPAHQPSQPAKQKASQLPACNERNPEVHQAQSTVQPSRQKKEGSKRASLTSTWDGGDSNEPSKGQTAKRSRRQAARNSQGETSQQRKRLKRNCPRQHRFSQPMRRRLLSAIERKSSARGSSQQHCCTARAQGYITRPESTKESVDYRSQQKKKKKKEDAMLRRYKEDNSGLSPALLRASFLLLGITIL